MANTKQNQIAFLKNILENAYNPNIQKKELLPEAYTADFFNSNSKLLKNLPPLLSPYFSEYMDELVNSSDNYRVVWFGTLLKYLYVGKNIDIPLPVSWQDLMNFHDGCVLLLKKLIDQ